MVQPTGLLTRNDPLARILDLADDAIISIDHSHHILLFNQGAEKMFGYTAQEIAGKPLEVLLPPQLAEAHRHHIDSFEQSGVAARRMGERREILGRRKDGTEFPAEASISKVALGDEIMFTVIMRDVTLRTLADQRLKASLREKEVLLEEVHHRVKNNLQVISSLLGLQARSISDMITRKKFEESQNRIQSMALLHESLYQSEDLARIDFADYLARLASQVFAFYDTGARVALHTQLQPLPLDMNTAVPCGLIVNELVSNALKYGFPDGREGAVQIKLFHSEPGTARLVVSDNGKGLPPDLDWLKTPSLGLRLVRTLARQLDASVELSQVGGTSFTISFAVSAKGKA
jgi:two-component system, sensor histidine kinase PdtaS